MLYFILITTWNYPIYLFANIRDSRYFYWKFRSLNIYTSVAPGVKGFSAWGNFPMNLMKLKKKGKSSFLLIVQSLAGLPLACSQVLPLWPLITKTSSIRPLPAQCTFSPLAHPFQQELHRCVPGDWQAPNQLGLLVQRGGENGHFLSSWINRRLCYGKQPLVCKWTRARWDILGEHSHLPRNLLKSLCHKAKKENNSSCPLPLTPPWGTRNFTVTSKFRCEK